MRIVCQQTILVKYHTLFFQKLPADDSHDDEVTFLICYFQKGGKI